MTSNSPSAVADVVRVHLVNGDAAEIEEAVHEDGVIEEVLVRLDADNLLRSEPAAGEEKEPVVAADVEHALPAQIRQDLRHVFPQPPGVVDVLTPRGLHLRRNSVHVDQVMPWLERVEELAQLVAAVLPGHHPPAFSMAAASVVTHRRHVPLREPERESSHPLTARSQLTLHRRRRAR